MISGISLFVLSLLVSPHQAASPERSSAGKQSKSAQAAQKTKSFDELAKAADHAREADRDDDAIRLYQEALKLRPGWQEGLWYLSTLLYQKERFAESRDLLRQFVAIEPKAGPGWALLGMGEYQTHEYSRALDQLKHAMREGWEGRKDLAQSVFYFVSVLLTRFEQYDDSMTLLFAMVKSGEQPDLIVEPLGLAALRLPLLPPEIPPDRRELIRMAGQGSLSIESHNPAETERLFGEMVARYPNEPGVHFLYGAFLLDVRPEDGIREMKRELEISPSHVGARLRLAEEDIKELKFEEALQLAEEAVKLEPSSAQAHMILGETLVGKGDAARGVAELETARKQAPDSVRTHWDLLRAYSSAGRSEDARREKEEIEKLSRPESQQAP
jgi:tetratricopeptide (TPR) repeat protein